MPTPRETAEAFSRHRFRDAYAALAPDVRWTRVGEGVVIGRQEVVDACESTLGALTSTTTRFTRFVLVADAGGAAAAVDVVARYVDADGATSEVSSCDIYEFSDGLLTTITSYAVELDQTGP
ncbi:nuclear transport factor 2 family protein [Blastococcus litoris]|uniref:nuclear transport factor 2 family protein n=1 Tax=Blastococcus litoris TaxID=2171622 RepID=UPI000E306D10|nr:nuclear transport factor 2 family protein [Blastococcus litoris]